MNVIRPDRDNNITVMSHSECRFRDGRRVNATKSAAPVLRTLPNRSHGVEVALQKEAAPIPGMEGIYTFDGLADRPVLEEHSPSRIKHTQFVMSIRVEDTVGDHIVSTSASVEDAFMRLRL